MCKGPWFWDEMSSGKKVALNKILETKTNDCLNSIIHQQWSWIVNCPVHQFKRDCEKMFSPPIMQQISGQKGSGVPQCKRFFFFNCCSPQSASWWQWTAACRHQPQLWRSLRAEQPRQRWVPAPGSSAASGSRRCWSRCPRPGCSAQMTAREKWLVLNIYIKQQGL